MFWSAVLVIVGLIFNRFNASMLALAMRPGYTYYPHWMEIAISLGLVAIALIVFQIVIRLLPVVHLEESEEKKLERISPDKGVSVEVTNV